MRSLGLGQLGQPSLVVIDHYFGEWRRLRRHIVRIVWSEEDHVDRSPVFNGILTSQPDIVSDLSLGSDQFIGLPESFKSGNGYKGHEPDQPDDDHQFQDREAAPVT